MTGKRSARLPAPDRSSLSARLPLAALLTAAFLMPGCSEADAGADSGSAAPADLVSAERQSDAGAATAAAALEDSSTPPESAAPAPAASSTPAASAERPGADRAGNGDVAIPATAATDAGAATDATVEEPRPPSKDASPEQILRATSRAYEGLRSFRAGFDQRLRNTLLGRTTESQGTLYQRQPDLFLMDFSDPEGDLIVSDGDWFWMYFPSVDEKQVLRTPRGAQGLDLHAQFIGDPVERFEYTYHGTEAVRGRQAHVMTLVPREPLGYRSLKAWIDADDHLVRRFELSEPNGNLRFFELRDLVVNPSLPDSLFEFTPPPGSQVVTR